MNSDFEKYLGDTIHKDGKHHATIVYSKTEIPIFNHEGVGAP